MKLYLKTFLTITFAALFISLFAVCSCAADSGAYDIFYNNNGGIVCVSHRGNTADFPENSLEAVVSASDLGADLVSVSVGKTADGVLVLCDAAAPLSEICITQIKSISLVSFDEASQFPLYMNDGTQSDCFIPTLESVVLKLDGKSLLVLDDAWDFRDEIAALAKKLGAEKNVLLRTDASSKTICEWTKENSGIAVIGIYDGGIIFNAISHFNRLSDAKQPAVQFQSKNYFNVFYGNTVTKRFSADGSPRAVAPMYDPDLCGQREDSSVGWDEMLRKGYSVIETNCIASLAAYIKNAESARETLSQLTLRAETVDTSLFSAVSAKNFSSALKNAKSAVENKNSSLAMLERSYSLLDETMNNLTFHASGDIQKGNLNLTAGKIAAAVIVGCVLFAGEIYVYKMHKPGRKKEKGSRH